MKVRNVLGTLLPTLLLCSCTVGGGIDLNPKKPSSTEESVAPVDPATVKASVLFVGNSFTYWNTMPEQIAGPLGNAMGMQLTVDSVTKGSQHLIDTANSNDELGRVFDEKVNNNQYDVIILQEHSTTPTNNYNSFLSGVQAMLTKIKAKQQNAKVYLYATWAFTNMVKQGETIPQAEYRIREAYHNCAEATGTSVVDVGKAFSYVYTNHNTIGLYDPNDNKHPSYAGSYLSAATHIATIFGVDVQNSTFRGDVDDATATTLKKVAYEVAKNLIK